VPLSASKPSREASSRVAVTFLEPAVRMLNEGEVHHPNTFRVHGDLIEALARIGRHEEAELTSRSWGHDAGLTGSAWASAVAARCRAVPADDGVTRAYRKIGVRSRAELAGILRSSLAPKAPV
jgi:hypothetical protein